MYYTYYVSHSLDAELLLYKVHIYAVKLILSSRSNSVIEPLSFYQANILNTSPINASIVQAALSIAIRQTRHTDQSLPANILVNNILVNKRVIILIIRPMFVFFAKLVLQLSKLARFLLMSVIFEVTTICLGSSRGSL